MADQVIGAIQEGKLGHIFLVGGCDGSEPQRRYYANLSKTMPQTSIVLTLGCGKFRCAGPPGSLGSPAGRAAQPGASRPGLSLAAIQPGEAAPLDEISKWGFIERPSLGIPFNVSDHPALSLCCGFGRLGLPLAFQLVGRRADEMLLLRAGHAYEASTPWHSRRPGI